MEESITPNYLSKLCEVFILAPHITKNIILETEITKQYTYSP